MTNFNNKYTNLIIKIPTKLADISSDALCFESMGIPNVSLLIEYTISFGDSSNILCKGNNRYIADIKDYDIKEITEYLEETYDKLNDFDLNLFNKKKAKFINNERFNYKYSFKVAIPRHENSNYGDNDYDDYFDTSDYFDDDDDDNSTNDSLLEFILKLQVISELLHKNFIDFSNQLSKRNGYPNLSFNLQIKPIYNKKVTKNKFFSNWRESNITKFQQYFKDMLDYISLNINIDFK